MDKVSIPVWPWKLPLPTWLANYQVEWLKSDVLAGVTLAAYAIPVALAYATLARMPPQTGIYCYIFGGLAYATLGSSRQLAIGPTSAIALMLGTTIGGIVQDDPDRWTEVAGLTALVVAGLSLLAWTLRLSALTSFVSETILLGFKAGAALTIALTQLPKLFGVAGGGEHFFERLWILCRQLWDTNFTVLAFGLVALALLLAGEKLLPGRPIALLVVALSVVIVSIAPHGLGELQVVGELPHGLPQLRLPSLRLGDLDGVIPLASACFLLSYIESISAARAFAAKNGYSVNSRKELLGIGAANFAVAFAQGFPVAGGLSQSAVNDKAGACTPLALVIASASLVICLICLTGLLQNLPTVVLASIVIVAVRGLVDLSALRQLRRVSRNEFWIAMFTLAGVLLMGILKGVLLATVVSLLVLISAAARPYVAFLGRIPGTQRFSDFARHSDNKLIPRVLIFRVESSLLYFNVDYVRQVVWEKVKAGSHLRLVICDLSSSPSIDVAGARMLLALERDLNECGIRLRLVEPHFHVRDLLRAEGLEKQVGDFGRHFTIDQAILERADSV